MRVDPKSAMIGVACAFLLAGGLGRWNQPAAQSAPRPDADPSQVMVFPAALGEKVHYIYICDPKSLSLAVYRMDTARSELKLDAVRCFRWDLRLSHYNSTKPYPADVRRTVQLEESQ